MKVVAYITASVNDGPLVTIPLTFNTNDPIMRFEFGDDGELLTYETCDPEFRAHVERMYAAIGAHAMRQPLPTTGD